MRIADLGESSADRLARAVRARLRRDHGIEAGIPVVLSTERPRCALVPAGGPGANPLDYQVPDSLVLFCNTRMQLHWQRYSSSVSGC